MRADGVALVGIIVIVADVGHVTHDLLNIGVDEVITDLKAAVEGSLFVGGVVKALVVELDEHAVALLGFFGDDRVEIGGRGAFVYRDLGGAAFNAVAADEDPAREVHRLVSADIARVKVDRKAHRTRRDQRDGVAVGAGVGAVGSSALGLYAEIGGSVDGDFRLCVHLGIGRDCQSDVADIEIAVIEDQRAVRLAFGRAVVAACIAAKRHLGFLIVGVLERKLTVGIGLTDKAVHVNRRVGSRLFQGSRGGCRMQDGAVRHKQLSGDLDVQHVICLVAVRLK